jgi:cysteinyl-tRNA synthetase
MHFFGPRVCNYAHIDSLRTSLLHDILARILKIDTYNPCIARNIIDVDDKSIHNSIKSDVTFQILTEK